jgi:hypothetical protein
MKAWNHFEWEFSWVIDIHIKVGSYQFANSKVELTYYLSFLNHLPKLVGEPESYNTSNHKDSIYSKGP